MKSKKNRSWLALFVFIAIAFTQTGANPTGTPYQLVRIALSNYPTQMKQIHQMDLDVAGVDLNSKTVDLIVSEAQVKTLRTQGFNIIETKSKVSMTKPDNQYQTPEKVIALLKKYEATYPHLAKVYSAGKSMEGRDIAVIKLTSNVSQNNPAKPRIFFNGMHHAREVMSVEVPIDTINVLLTQYGHDAKVTHWLDSYEVWVMPMFNVDGNNVVWTKESMWRKNTHGGYGVDINRNYPYAWNSCNGSSSYQGAQDYHGESAGSEVETKVMMNLVKLIHPVFSISYHSYSEIVIYPYGCEGQHVPNREVVEGIGSEMAALIVNDNQSGHYTAGTAPELLYSVDGGDIDWFYHEAQVIPYVIEVNSSGQGFQPSYSKWRESTVARVRPAWQLLLNKMDGASIRGQVQDAQGNGIAHALVHLVRVSGGKKFTQDYPAQDNGYFNVILPSGNYEVIITAPGLKAKTQTVHVDNAPVMLQASLLK